MTRDLLVLLGAGASHDVVPPGRGPAIGLVPPLTKELFEHNDLSEAILPQYPGARDLASVIRYEVPRRLLEDVLYDFYDAPDGSSRARAFPEVMLYLNDFFRRISSQYTTQPINYSRLLDKIFSASPGFDRVMFVSLNYDTIFEAALQPIHMGLTDIDSYVSDERCSLVKLHGSIDWSRRIALDNDEAQRIINTAAYLDFLRQTGLRKLTTRLSTGITLRPSENRYVDGFGVWYPALAAPIGRNYLPQCPPAHVTKLQEFLQSQPAILAIGVSGMDKHLLRLMEENLPRSHVVFFCFVGKGDDQAFDRFLGDVPQLSALPDNNSSGFTAFLAGTALDNFFKLVLRT